MVYDAKVIADWFAAWADAEDEGELSNLKLQKLLYYAQGQFLAFTGEPLFVDEIEAWSHGPVVRSQYHRFKEFGSGPIPPPEDFDWDAVDGNTTQFLIRVWELYGQYSAWRLREMTHEERPWREAFDGTPRKVIPKESIHAHFATLYR